MASGDKIAEFSLAGDNFTMGLFEAGDNGNVLMKCTDESAMEGENNTHTLIVNGLPQAGMVCALLEFSEDMHERKLLDTVPMFKATYDFIKSSSFASLLP